MEAINKESIMAAMAQSSTPLTQTTSNYLNSTERLPHTVNGKLIHLPIPVWIHTKFLEGFTHKWKFTELPSTWTQGISIMTVEQIRKAVSRSLLEGNGWPPSLPEFISLGNDPVDFSGAFDRCMAKEPSGRAEQFVYENSAFNIRRLNQGEAERFHKRELLKAIELEKAGRLHLNSDRLKALPPNSVKNVNDLAREEFEEKNKGKLNPRIAKILAEKKANHE